MFKNFIPCGRRVCVCQRDLWKLYLEVPFNSITMKETKSKIDAKKKDYKSCFGSYKVMVGNLEKKSQYRNF
jgi:hypothetical protein